MINKTERARKHIIYTVLYTYAANRLSEPLHLAAPTLDFTGGFFLRPHGAVMIRSTFLALFPQMATEDIYDT